MNTELLRNIIKQFIPFAQKHIGFKDPPRLFLRNDPENAKNPFGKTAFYDPNEKAVTLYVTGRHPKDILRSLGHELVHHKQNCAGQFSDSDDMGEGYAQRDPHLRQMEMEANRDGSMCLRDFEDKLKKENTIYYEHLQKGDKKMSTKDWKNKELTTLLSEAWGFKFNSLQEFEEFNGSGELQAEAEEESLEEGEEEELDEQSKTDSADRGAGRAQGGRRLDEEEDELDEALEEGDDEELDEAAKPDYIDLDKDGDKEESMKKAAADAKKKKHGDDDKKNESVDPLQEAIANLLRKKLRG
jgi:hypothetical protein